jgi:hypothetical protein
MQRGMPKLRHAVLVRKPFRAILLGLWRGVLALLGLAMLFLSVALADAKPEAPDDAVAFFKRALASPPDVEGFEASMITLRERLSADSLKHLSKNMMNVTPKVQYFEGARAGTNFFLHSKSLREPMTSGRFGSEAYTVVSNGVSFGFEGFNANNPSSSDRISQASDSAFGLTCQFLSMGVSRVAPIGSSWTHDEFVGVNELGRSVYGRLELSNGLPWKLTVSWQRGAPPFKMIVYEYPEPLWSLAGFPKKITICVLFDDGLKPFLELGFSKVQLAKHPLADEFFQPARFITTNILRTNIWTKDKLISLSPRGKHATALRDLEQSLTEKQVSPWPRRIIRTCLALVTLLLIVFSLAQLRTRTAQHTVNKER